MAGELPRLNSKYCSSLTITRSRGNRSEASPARRMASGSVARNPCSKHGGVQLLALGGAGRRALGRRVVFGGTLGGIGRLEQHPQETGVDVGDAALRVRIGGPDDTLRAGLVGEEPLDEIVDRLRGVGSDAGPGIAQIVMLHAAE